MDHSLRLSGVPKSTPPSLLAALDAATVAWHEKLGPRLVSIVLFGSVARGAARESSDIDLVIVASDVPRSLTERTRWLRQIWERVRVERHLPPVEWNLVVKTPAEAAHHSPLYLDIVEDGILLFDRDSFFRSILDAMRARMQVLGSRRVFLPDGAWYWDLKPDYRFGDVVEI